MDASKEGNCSAEGGATGSPGVAVRAAVLAMAGYTPGEQPRPGERVIKLNTNESPLPPSPAVMAALRDVPPDALRRYPDPTAGRIRRAAAEVWNGWGITPEMVIAGNGSDDLLTIVTRTAVGEGGTAVYPWPTYSLYDSLCEIQGARPVHVDWPADWSLPREALLAAAEEHRAGLVFLANPNAPSGTAVPVAELVRLAEGLAKIGLSRAHADGAARPWVVDERGLPVGPLLVVDEAYADFAGDTCIRVVTGVPNMVVLRTFSKSYALAGARIGIGLCSAALAREFHKVRDSYNVDAVCDRMGAAALLDQDHLRRTVELVRTERARLTERLRAMGFAVPESQANFVLARRSAPAAAELNRRLRESGILVRYFDKPGLRDALRISVGLPEENDALLAELGRLVGAA